MVMLCYVKKLIVTFLSPVGILNANPIYADKQ